MMLRTDDPLTDFDQYDRECYEDEKLFPVCDICGERIADDYYLRIGDMIIHEGCAERHSVESYIENRR